MAFKLASGVAETTTTTGTGAVVLAGAVSGYRTFTSFMAQGDTTFYRIQENDTEWEVGVLTKGSVNYTRSVIVNSSGGTSPLNLSAGTKTVACVPVAERTVALSAENHWTASQYLDGQKLYLNTLGTHYIVGNDIDDSFDIYFNDEFLARFDQDTSILQSPDRTDEANPTLRLDRASISPTDDDNLGQIVFRGRDSGVNPFEYASIHGEIADVTDATEDGRLKLKVGSGGAQASQPGASTMELVLDGALRCAYMAGGVSAPVYLLMGRDARGTTDNGIELDSDGRIVVCRASNDLLELRRNTSTAGRLIAAYLNGVNKGGLNVTTTGVALSQPSDERLKDKITRLLGAGPIVDGIEVWTYRHKQTGEIKTGFIAQNLKTVVPEAVLDTDPMEVTSVDPLMPYVIAELQSMRMRIGELESQLAGLMETRGD